MSVKLMTEEEIRVQRVGTVISEAAVGMFLGCKVMFQSVRKTPSSIPLN